MMRYKHYKYFLTIDICKKKDMNDLIFCWHTYYSKFRDSKIFKNKKYTLMFLKCCLIFFV